MKLKILLVIGILCMFMISGGCSTNRAKTKSAEQPALEESGGQNDIVESETEEPTEEHEVSEDEVIVMNPEQEAEAIELATKGLMNIFKKDKDYSAPQVEKFLEEYAHPDKVGFILSQYENVDKAYDEIQIIEKAVYHVDIRELSPGTESFFVVFEYQARDVSGLSISTKTHMNGVSITMFDNHLVIQGIHDIDIIEKN